MKMSYRDQGTSALSTVLNKEQNIRIIEKAVFESSISEAKSDDDDKIEKIYNSNLYQIIGDILNDVKLNDIIANIKNGKTSWTHPCFQEFEIKMEEQDNFIENPFEVVEGVQQCKSFNKKTGKMCNSKRVIYYQVMHRGCDEPMTTHNTCCICGSKWSYSG